MPELPEVQTVVNDLEKAGLIGREITGARVFWPRTVSGVSPKGFCQKIKGKRVSAIWRRGKFIVFELTEGFHLLVHLRMTGRFLFTSGDRPRARHEHVILKFGRDVRLRFHDTRKFGRFYLLKNPGKILGRLGVEPLYSDFTMAILCQALLSRKRKLKPLLLDQTVIAGIGNIYADEALWEAKIHPERISSSLGSSEIRGLFRAIPKVLRQGLKNMGTTLGGGKTNFYSIAGYNGRNREQLKVFRRAGKPCPRCRTIIRRMLVGQRSTFICRRCQPLND